MVSECAVIRPTFFRVLWKFLWEFSNLFFLFKKICTTLLCLKYMFLSTRRQTRGCHNIDTPKVTMFFDIRETIVTLVLWRVQKSTFLGSPQTRWTLVSNTPMDMMVFGVFETVVFVCQTPTRCSQKSLVSCIILDRVTRGTWLSLNVFVTGALHPL